MKVIRTILKKHYFRKAVIYCVTYCLLFNTTAVWALDEGNLDSATGLNSATWGLDGSATLNTANGAILNWNNFDTTAVQSVTFNQPGIDASVLNRISGATTQFDGSLISNGNVFIVNPAGVYFGPNSSVNVNQLIASSLDILNFDIENPDFLAGKYEFAAATGATGGIINDSQDMYAIEGIALLGKYVTNNGTITAGQGGFVVMAAADKVYLGTQGGNIIIEMKSVTPDGADDGKVINNGDITTPEGKVALASGDVTAQAETTAYGAGDIYTTAIDLPKVSGGIGTVQQNGTIDTSSQTAGGEGGEIGLTANDSVTLSAGSNTLANAGTGGDAGLVVVHSKGQTTIQNGATIETVGGHEPFNLEGDFDDIVDTTVEITGEEVSLAGTIDASATEDRRGKIIIDAYDITVADGYRPTIPLINTVYEKWIEAQSDVATDVELVAHSKEAGDITVQPLTDGVLSGGSGDIVMRTKYNTGGITFEGTDPSSIITDDGGNVYMLAGKGGISIGDVTTYLDQHDPREPGKIRISTTDGEGGDITTGSLSVEGGSYDEISVVAKGNLIVNGDISTYAHQVDEELSVYQARTCLVSDTGDVTVNGTISLYTQGKYGTTADLHIDAGHDIALNPGSQQITVEAKTVTSGPSNASVKLHAGKATDPEIPEDTGSITINGVSYENAGDKIHLKAQAGGGAGTAEVSSADDPANWDEKVGTIYDDETGEPIDAAHAKLEINEKHMETCEECPVPPGLTPPIDPVGTPDFGSTHMGDATSGNVLDNDDPEPGRTLTVISNTDPEHGTLYILSNGDFQYTPDPGYVGDDSFTYVAYDGESSTDPITVTITMLNNAPTPQADAGETHMGTSVTFNIETDLLSNDTDPDSDDVFFGSASYTGSGSLVDNGDGTLTYTPADGYVGNDAFTYTVTDPQIDGTPVQSTVTISMTNNPPTPGQDSDSTHMGTALTISIADLLNNDTDPDSDDVFFGSASYTGSGSLVDNGDGTLTYTPVQGFVGNDTFTYTVTDPQIGGTPVQTTVVITMSNNLPQVGDDTILTDFAKEISGNVLDNDIDPDQDNLTVVLDGVSPEHGTVVLNPDGSFVYTPEAGYNGDDSFAYLVTDGQLDGVNPVTLTGTVRITVNPFINAAPLPVNVEMNVSGCPALLQWTAQEIGSTGQAAQIWVTNTLASPKDIQPCEACSNLREASLLLSDTTYVEALSRIINNVVSPDAPISEEQMASINTAIANSSENDTDLAYAKNYIETLQNYVNILNRNLELNTDDSVMVAVDNYIAPLAEDNTNVAVYLTAMLTNPQ